MTARCYGPDLARIHHAGFGAFAAAAAPGLIALLRQAGIRDGLVVELGCGTGIVARALTRAGYRVVGIDRSAAMLRIARRTAPDARFRRATLQRADLPRSRAVLAIGEPLAYVPPATLRPALLPTFRRIARALEPGGLLVFDLIVPAPRVTGVVRTWRTGPGWAVLSQAIEDRANRLLTREIVTFVGDRGRWRRRTERHVVALYTRREVVAWLRRAGFRTHTARAYGRAALLPQRLAFVARKRS
ncbi:MAG TPA: class I SAM-dependent methyltransferase [Vicinamibacterales bacterium]|nr:class I SAM-dependent methyltransferase [Vicinamibacterales bacterium]